MEILPVPVVPPITFPDVVPILTLPDSTEIPVKIPGAVTSPLVVDKRIPPIVLPCTLDTGLMPTVSSIALYRLAYAPLYVVVPVDDSLEKPIILLLTV